MPENQQRSTELPVGGLVLIVLGAIFLLRNLEIIDIGHRWWALFFLIPIGFALNSASNAYRTNGRKLVPQVLNHLTWGALLAVMMLVFLVDASMHVWWPAFVILAGLLLLVRTRS
jgi:hypothetical protein